MTPRCTECGKEMVMRTRGMPTSLWRCPSMNHSAAMIVMSHDGCMPVVIPITQPVLKQLYTLAAVCPDLENAECPCAWHREISESALFANIDRWRRKDDEPFIPEDTREDSDVYYYGRTA